MNKLLRCVENGFAVPLKNVDYILESVHHEYQIEVHLKTGAQVTLKYGKDDVSKRDQKFRSFTEKLQKFL